MARNRGLLWVWTARVAKSGRVVRELVQVPDDECPDGAGFDTRHEAKAWAKSNSGPV